MKTAISLPDHDFARFERAAAEQGLNRSEFYRRAAESFVSTSKEGADLTKLADAALDESGQPSEDNLFLTANEQRLARGSDW